MYRLYGVDTDIDHNRKLTHTRKVFFDYNEFEGEIKKHPEYYRGKAWLLMPETDDYISVTL